MYPLKLRPEFQGQMWGGSRLRDLLGKKPPSTFNKTIAESWELADLPAGTVKGDVTGKSQDGALSSTITNGDYAGSTLRDLLADADLQAAIMGSVALINGHFPLLVKFLDAAANVSVQVHPDAAYCKAHPEAHLKCEAWYVVLAEPGAKIYRGVKAGTTAKDFRAALQTNNVEPLLHAIPARAGDCHYLPSGTLHALGAGCTVVEVQTPSDTTFRVFDWNRLGSDGKPRQLHVEQAMACIVWGEVRSQKPEARMTTGISHGQTQTDTDRGGGGNSKLETRNSKLETRNSKLETRNSKLRKASCEYFVLDQMQAEASEERMLVGGEPVVWVVIEGQGVIHCDGHAPTAFVRGDTLLLPTGIKGGRMRTLTPCTWLEARVPGEEAKQ